MSLPPVCCPVAIKSVHYRLRQFRIAFVVMEGVTKDFRWYFCLKSETTGAITRSKSNTGNGTDGSVKLAKRRVEMASKLSLPAVCVSREWVVASESVGLPACFVMELGRKRRTEVGNKGVDRRVIGRNDGQGCFNLVRDNFIRITG